VRLATSSQSQVTREIHESSSQVEQMSSQMEPILRKMLFMRKLILWGDLQINTLDNVAYILTDLYQCLHNVPDFFYLKCARFWILPQIQSCNFNYGEQNFEFQCVISSNLVSIVDTAGQTEVLHTVICCC